MCAYHMYIGARWNTCMRVGKCLEEGREANMRVREEWENECEREPAEKERERKREMKENLMSDKKEGNTACTKDRIL